MSDIADSRVAGINFLGAEQFVQVRSIEQMSPKVQFSRESPIKVRIIPKFSSGLVLARKQTRIHKIKQVRSSFLPPSRNL